VAIVFTACHVDQPHKAAIEGHLVKRFGEVVQIDYDLPDST
jgi:hypothetical protein